MVGWTTRAMVLALTMIGCTAEVEGGEHVAEVAQPIVNGSLSTSAQDATVMLSQNGQFSCTGTLVAPNLVLTARHCVATLDSQGLCGFARTDMTPSSFKVSLGVNASPALSAARGARLFVPSTKDLCGADIALIELDKDIPGAKVANVRFTPPSIGEPTTAVGYGDNGVGQLTPGRYQRTGVTVQAVGPRAHTYRTGTGQGLAFEVPSGDFVTGEATCFGDSGGPLFDAEGAVIGVTSRGIDDLCLDRPTIWVSVAAHQKLIEDAATAAGHPLGGGSASAGGTEDDGDPTPSSKDEAGDEGDGEDVSSSRAPRRKGQLASSGCGVAVAPRGASTGAALAAVACAAAALAQRRRRQAAPRR